MALLTDDMDQHTAFFRVITGGNGDYYPQIIWKDDEGINHCIGTRVAMSGGVAPIEVKLAVVELYRALEKYKLNEHPLDEPERWPNTLNDARALPIHGVSVTLPPNIVGYTVDNWETGKEEWVPNPNYRGQ